MVNFFEDAECIIKYECNRVAIKVISFKTSFFYKCILMTIYNQINKSSESTSKTENFPGVGCFCSFFTQFP